MATAEEIRKIIDDSGESVKIILHYRKFKDVEKPVYGFQYGDYKCLENLEYDRDTLKKVLKQIVEETLKEI